VARERERRRGGGEEESGVQNQTLERWAENDRGPKEGKVKGNSFLFLENISHGKEYFRNY
jgi:hypothetical protein